MIKFRMVFAWTLLVSSLVGWPISLYLTDEPPFILSLSWLALTLTAYDILSTTDVRKQAEEKESK